VSVLLDVGDCGDAAGPVDARKCSGPVNRRSRGWIEWCRRAQLSSWRLAAAGRVDARDVTGGYNDRGHGGIVGGCSASSAP
jgi:hypothetical protein